MVPRETGNNAYANFLEGQTKSIMVFFILANFYVFGARQAPRN